ncbi:MAG: hypothetical protein ABIR96_03095 [Bdellovibrionota bacterium]
MINVKNFQQLTSGLSLLVALSLFGCASASQDPWPDAQDQMAGFAQVTSQQARRPGSASANPVSCFDASMASGISANATIELELTHADVAYAAENGAAVTLRLAGSLRTVAEVERTEKGTLRRNGFEITTLGPSDSVTLDTFQTVTMPRTIKLRVSGIFINELLQKTPNPEASEILVGIERTYAEGRPQNLGRMILSLGDIRTNLQKNPYGYSSEEKLSLKYRGLALVTTSVSCGNAPEVTH